MKNNSFMPHNIKWNKEKVNNFWNYYVNNSKLSELSVAQDLGEEIIKLVLKYIKKDGNNLDYGCGAGYLMKYLFDKRIFCQGLDSSIDSIQKVKRKFKENKFFKGIILSTGFLNDNIADNSYDFVFCIETVEHIIPEELSLFFRELYRIVKPGGYLFVSTRNNENLDKKRIICPDCGCIFHRVQHMNSFTSHSLNEMFNKVGFSNIFCKATLLNKTRSYFDKGKYLINFFRSKLTGAKMFKPDLVYLGIKK